ncbi:MAG: type II toxin-antitoxin system HicA family toxin [Candidatus Pacebacteria bacterium]|nr:type II toxin-antitoxin system HicA family toxin [Candidatus Paceibacterota bacterium]
MTRSLYNWTAKSVIKFLERYGFHNTHTRGSHYYYSGKYEGRDHQVVVPVHGNKSIKPRTLKGIIAQSGICKEKWFYE